ncbi:TetR/AcrR family transcriptional regulator [Micromonospora sp. NPDC023737]|uniref:TetR/AcrR family transcriptional regulator n=1 Tax=unclassified Micromonospora TaxID=2617518 RepID=UPI0033F28B00
MSDTTRAPSARREELLESAYQYVLRCGLADLSLRPLATAIGSSPRVLLFLFGSKDGLIRDLLARARREELALLDQVRSDPAGGDPTTVVRATWRWLVAPAHRPLLTLWLEAYARSLVDPRGPWAGFARQTVDDWLTLLAGPPNHEHTGGAGAEPTLTLAVLRGVLLDLLATGDIDRTTAAVERHLSLVDTAVPGPA